VRGYNVLIPDVSRRWLPAITLPLMDALQALGHTPVTLNMVSINNMYRQLRYQRRGCYEIFQFYLKDIVSKGHIDFGLSPGLGIVLEDPQKQEAHHLLEECGVPNILYLHGRTADAARKLESLDAASWRHTVIASSSAALLGHLSEVDQGRALHVSPGTSLRIYYPAADPPADAPYPLLSDDERLAGGFEVCFAGSHSPGRERLLAALDDAGVALAVFGDKAWQNSAVAQLWRGQVNYLTELNTVYNSSAIVLDLPHEDCELEDYVSTRLPDCLASGSLLLTYGRPGLGRLMAAGEEAAVFDGETQLVESARHYLANPAERESLAARGRRRAAAEHGWADRVGQLLPALELQLLSTAV